MSQVLLNQLYTARKNEKKYTFEVLKYLKEVDRRKLYVSEGHSSLDKFCVEILGYSKTEAWLRVQAVRAMKTAPKIEKKLENNEMSLTTAADLNGFIRAEKPSVQEQNALIEEVSGEPIRKAKEIIDKKKKQPPEQTLTIKLPERILKKLRSLQSDFGDNTELEVIEALIDKEIREKDLRKTDRDTKAKSPSEAGAKAVVRSKSQRYIPRIVKREVFRGANHRCQKCSSGVNLQLDHIKPIKVGGKSFAGNLQVLCFSCNQYKDLKTQTRLRPD